MCDCNQRGKAEIRMNRRICWAGRDPSGSSSPIPGLAQDIPRMPPCAWECCSKAPWIQARVLSLVTRVERSIDLHFLYKNNLVGFNALMYVNIQIFIKVFFVNRRMDLTGYARRTSAFLLENRATQRGLFIKIFRKIHKMVCSAGQREKKKVATILAKQICQFASSAFAALHSQTGFAPAGIVCCCPLPCQRTDPGLCSWAACSEA